MNKALRKRIGKKASDARSLVGGSQEAFAVRASECIERCKEIQRVNEEVAETWRKISISQVSAAREIEAVYREVATELAKALEGF